MWHGANILTKSIENCFRNVPKESTLSKRMLERENDPEQFIKRISPQVLECYYKEYPFATPEEWDNAFNILGGGQGRRTSAVILKRMTWDQFLYNAELIIKGDIDNEQRD